MKPEDEWTEFDDTSSTLLRAGQGRHWWHTSRRTGGFRMVELNGVGWTAVLAPGAVVGAAVATLLDRHAVVGAIGGAAASSLLAVAADQRRYRDSTAVFSLGTTERTAAERVRDDLLAEGVHVELAWVPDEIDASDEILSWTWAIQGRMKDRRAITRKVWPESPSAWR